MFTWLSSWSTPTTPTTSMEDQLLNLKLTMKELNRHAKRAEKEENAERLKCKKAIAKGNMAVARIHARNAIRKRSQSFIYLRMSATVDAVSSRFQAAVTTSQVETSMPGVVQVMDEEMTTAVSAVPQNSVDNLMHAVADEVRHERNMEPEYGGETGTEPSASS